MALNSSEPRTIQDDPDATTPPVLRPAPTGVVSTEQFVAVVPPVTGLVAVPPEVKQNGVPGVVGKKYSATVPLCGRAPPFTVPPNGSPVVFANEKPVSKPLPIDTNGMSMLVVAGMMLTTVRAGDGI